MNTMGLFTPLLIMVMVMVMVPIASTDLVYQFALRGYTIPRENVTHTFIVKSVCTCKYICGLHACRLYTTSPPTATRDITCQLCTGALQLYKLQLDYKANPTTVIKSDYQLFGALFFTI
ncbi:uncharacterized protein LOC108679705 [Hyalella azteca]|uniref:Uncharacterized protein LOC108679705 n=1 Tax=Hyalella azteca TaxID=294128 RepID=A0A979FNJ8_HYAAZ|nr:uncharacterized protein LOC108679705 [Hyalella azteca]